MTPQKLVMVPHPHRHIMYTPKRKDFRAKHQTSYGTIRTYIFWSWLLLRHLSQNVRYGSLNKEHKLTGVYHNFDPFNYLLTEAMENSGKYMPVDVSVHDAPLAERFVDVASAETLSHDAHPYLEVVAPATLPEGYCYLSKGVGIRWNRQGGIEGRPLCSACWALEFKMYRLS